MLLSVWIEVIGAAPVVPQPDPVWPTWMAAGATVMNILVMLFWNTLVLTFATPAVLLSILAVGCVVGMTALIIGLVRRRKLMAQPVPDRAALRRSVVTMILGATSLMPLLLLVIALLLIMMNWSSD